MIRELINKTMALSIGAAVTSKEQIEKFVDDLVKKGEVTEAESKALVDDLNRRREESKAEMDQEINLRILQRLEEMDLTTKEDIHRLEERLALLEERLGKA